MFERIVLRTTARLLTDDEMEIPGGAYGGVTGGQPTKKTSSQDPNGPKDDDESVLDW